MSRPTPDHQLAPLPRERRDQITGQPNHEEILAFLRDRPDAVGIADLSRQFGATGRNRTRLRLILRELMEEGLIVPEGRHRYALRPRLPRVTVVEIIGPDADGELLARPVHWTKDVPIPAIYLAPPAGGARAYANGERVLVRLDPGGEGQYEALPLRRLGVVPSEIIGVYERANDRGRLRPTDRRARRGYDIRGRHAHGARPGELVRARVLPHKERGMPQAEVVERIGSFDSPGAIGLIALHSNDIPIGFPDEALEEANTLTPASVERREDLRGVPFVTIDDEDAKDFDDAVYADPDRDPANGGGWRLIVAIADVAWYVRPGTSLDNAARQRGNSVYLPDRVVPMLPEVLSADLCSLKPGKDRAVLACHMQTSKDGRLLSSRFSRALIRSAARLTYLQTQCAHEGDGGAIPDALPKEAIAHLYGAYGGLKAARQRRGTLDLDLPEYRVELDETRRVRRISVRERLDSHRLIEEFMITANVAAAEALEAKRAPCMYRVHEPPDVMKLDGLREFLKTFGLSLPRGQSLQAKQFSDLLIRASRDPSAEVIHESILRCQSQAAYSPRNVGHFGLALKRYAHFTSPIRRYADVLVHRALIGSLGLGPGGLRPRDDARFEDIAVHISDTERRAQAAEREAKERYMVLYLEDRIGAHFKGRITGVTRFGLFVRLSGIGAEGIVPASLLGDERFHHDTRRHVLEGGSSRHAFTLGDDIEVRLHEADPVTGSLVFTVARHEETRKAGMGRPGIRRTGAAPRGRRSRSGRRPE